ncbi:MAG: sterol desaturase family protein [Bryobacteraceae bacterium]
MNNKRNLVSALLGGGWLAALVWWERRRALRSMSDSKIKRDARNLALAAAAGVTMQLLEFPVAFCLARQACKKRRGLLQLAPLPRPLHVIAAVALLDYTLYWWHILAHRVPLLWRFHQAHHLDREMDATTGLRFHFGEIALSVLFRAGQVFVIGPAPEGFTAWQSFLFACILFHHANVRLPLRAERALARFVITPRLHGIHHSVAPEEVNSNWSSGLTIWDWLHGTLRTEVRQDNIVIGVRGRRGDSDQELLNVLAVPFRDAAPVPPNPGLFVRQPMEALQ